MGMTQEQADKIKQETGAISIYVNQIYKNPRPVLMYNSAQVAFMKHILSTQPGVFTDVLNQIFVTKTRIIAVMERMYEDLLDID